MGAHRVPTRPLEALPSAPQVCTHWQNTGTDEHATMFSGGHITCLKPRGKKTHPKAKTLRRQKVCSLDGLCLNQLLKTATLGTTLGKQSNIKTTPHQVHAAHASVSNPYQFSNVNDAAEEGGQVLESFLNLTFQLKRMGEKVAVRHSGQGPARWLSR